MSGPRDQKARGVPDEKDIVGPFEWLRDRLYDFVNTEGDFALQFMADFIRGPDPVREEKHLKRQMRFQAGKGRYSATRDVKRRAKSQEKPLNEAEQKIFVDLLRRKPGEKQLPYWKRKKSLLNNPNKRELVKSHQEQQKAARQSKPAIIVEHQSLTASQIHRNKREAKLNRKTEYIKRQKLKR